ncbi:MAG: DUF1648 domain-containing protein [Winogradskyella sp.]
MAAERPKLKIPFKTVDICIEIASIMVLLLMWFHLILAFGNLPDTVPSHFNAAGQPDNYSGKGFLWFLPALGTLMYVGLFIINRYPHLHNYMVNITEENALIQYRFSTRVLRVVNFLCVLMFAYINYQIVIGAKNNTSSLGIGFLITIVVMSILLPVFIYLYQQKLKK